MKNGGTINIELRSERVHNRMERQLLAAAQGHADRAPAQRRPPVLAAPTVRKQPGRRYGPPPKNPPHPRMQAPEPMKYLTRLDIYAAQMPRDMAGFTVRQERQLRRHSDRLAWSEGLVPREGKKGHRTPKRREASQ